MHWFCVLCAPKPGNRLVFRDEVLWKPRLHCILGILEQRNLQFGPGFELSTAWMAEFRVRMLESPAKYKILWFTVDRPHRQRYFCICGCKQTVKKPAYRLSKRRKTCGSERAPVFPFAARLIPPQIWL